MKKMIFGLMLTSLGFICSALIIMSAVLSPLNPVSYNGIEGWLGSLLYMKLQLPLAAFILLAIAGLIICCVEAFRKEK
ncbi:MAG: hypothetical protein MJ177_01595 [Clostridia bacterium]|nr:hypothetical protein [Clostridia bacterium]